MLFNSFQFLLFFPSVTLLYFLFPHRFRTVLLLMTSCIFYAAFIPVYLLILIALIVADFFIAKQLYKKKGGTKKGLLIFGIIITLLPLFFFKYINFFLANILAGAHMGGVILSIPTVNLPLPIGLSFHTFQSISYLVDIYKRKQKPERHLSIYALFILFYPQLVAGPIERPEHMLPQFRRKHQFSYSRCKEGLSLMVRGYFKKMVVADNIALLVNHIFLMPRLYIGFPLLLGILGFSLQIFADFSGYTDIARGAAQVMGFQLVENFKFPYFATSLSQFWQRWHISLSSWFRDYIYIPLGGNRIKPFLRIRNVFITFALSGLWHGAAWTYVVWGILHGFFITVETILKDYLQSLQLASRKNLVFRSRTLISGAKMAYTFSLVCVAWVFFRASTLSDAMYILSSLPKGFGNLFVQIFQRNWHSALVYLFAQGGGLGVSGSRALIIVSSAMFLLLMEIGDYRHMRFLRYTPIRFMVIVVYVLSVINLGVTNEIPFIYFQF